MLPEKERQQLRSLFAEKTPPTSVVKERDVIPGWSPKKNLGDAARRGVKDFDMDQVLKAIQLNQALTDATKKQSYTLPSAAQPLNPKFRIIGLH